MTHAATAHEATWEYSVQVSATIESDPPAIRFSWPQDTMIIPDFYSVSRKYPEDSHWGTATILPGSSTSYTDTNVVPGVPYEYQFYKSNSIYVGYGYITAAINFPLVEQRGKLILLVEQSLTGPLDFELHRLEQDLIGDGWTVLRHAVPRQARVTEVKELINDDYASDPDNVNALFLFGRIPVPYSGDLAPDGHFDWHTGAWPADTFYGAMDGVWTDTTISNRTSGFLRCYNVPGDGKYDQSEIPGTVRLQIGRVDLSDMPGISNSVPTFPEETELLRQYLNKDHNYRHRKFSLPLEGLVFNETGDRGGEAFAADAWRNWAPLIGPPAARPLNVGEFLPILRTNGFLWSFATSGAGRNEMAGLGGAQAYNYYMAGTTLDFVGMDMRTSFVMLLGSTIGDWDMQDNLMRAVLATPSYGLASVYAGRPHWYFHPMGLGESLGYCARLTQNNHADGLYRNHSNNFAGFVHIALLGDPTLRLRPIAPPADFYVGFTPDGVELVWTASPDEVEGYYVYRAADPIGPFIRLTPALLQTNVFRDSEVAGGKATYMVRAVKLQHTPSGSYIDASQGIFASPSPPSFSFTVSGSGDFNLSFRAVPRRVYRIAYTTSLDSPDWNNLHNDLYATNSLINCSIGPRGHMSGSGWFPTNAFSTNAPAEIDPGTDTQTNSVSSQRFFRVHSIP